MNLSNQTLRDLALVVVFVADAAWDGAKDALERLRPHLNPPPDMSISSTEGNTYSGLILIDQNEVIAGITIRVGRHTSPMPSSRHEQAPSLGPSAWQSSSLARRFDDDEDEDEDDEGKLPGWAEDPRDRREPWRR